MSLRIGNRLFAPPAWAVLLTGVALAAFVGLGYWQLGRAREKQALFEAFMAAGEDTVDAGDLPFEQLARYQRIRLHGSYDSTRQVLLDNMPSVSGQPGYRVLTPFERSDGRGWVIVDRGWLPLGATREDLPELTVGMRDRDVTGTLDQLPVPGLRVGPAATPGASEWPRVMLFPTESDLESALGIDVESRIVLLDAGAPDGYERKWRPSIGFGPERHLGYAIQWFAFALVATVLFVALNLQRAQPGQES
ncbi:MAG: SURF1 family protein [Burkholderiaceae bacterium]|jgi:surfeit locus 1 family protein|nr:SURF1 family protein [Burkholderiaceae bacterium]